jgi:hypothetical protein
LRLLLVHQEKGGVATIVGDRVYGADILNIDVVNNADVRTGGAERHADKTEDCAEEEGIEVCHCWRLKLRNYRLFDKCILYLKGECREVGGDVVLVNRKID